MRTILSLCIAIIAACTLTACASIPRHVQTERIDPDSPTHFSLRYGIGRRATVTTQFFPDDREHIQLKRSDGSLVIISDPICVSTKVHAATVPLYPDMDVLLLVQNDHGTGYSSDELRLLNPREGEFVILTVTRFVDASTPISRIEVSDNFHDPRFTRERELLEALKLDYGYLSEHMLKDRAADIEYAAYFWQKDNAKVTDGPLKLRRYKGRHGDPGSTNGEVTDGDITYTAFFKNGVWAYDKKKDESFLLFFPENMYGWPNKILLWNHQILISHGASQLTLIDLKTARMRRMNVSFYSHELKSFSVTEDALILNDKTVLPFKTSVQTEADLQKE